MRGLSPLVWTVTPTSNADWKFDVVKTSICITRRTHPLGPVPVPTGGHPSRRRAAAVQRELILEDAEPSLFCCVLV